MKFINKVIIRILVLLNRWHLSIIEKNENILIVENKDEYEVLLPNTKTDKNKHYSNPFTVALKTPHVNNIAITGAYGSGKSSFLRTFERENAEWNYLPISLATFKDTQEDIEKKEKPKDDKAPSSTEGKEATEEGKEKSDLHQDIERSILQQFFYREKDSQVPYSRFKRIRNIQKKLIFYHSFVVGFLFLYAFSVFKTDKFIELFSINFFENDEYNYLSYISIGILLYYLYRFFTYLWNLQISKFNFKKGEITLAKQDKASILNEHLDEILYFFGVTEYDVVLFEDIDRFDDTEIFIKLRELNNLINNSKQIGRRVRFVYAIRDDMFVDKERTKFFDFILPIIPHINPSNSEWELKRKFKKEIDEKKIDRHFISKISWYIDDMRLLLNIYNEYMLYKNNLNSDSLDHNKILALIVCKNFYPLDFAKLHIREGSIYKLFYNKDKYRAKQIKQYKEEKTDILVEIKNIENENIKNIDELKMIYLGRLFSETEATVMTIDNYEKKSLTELFLTNLFDEIDSNITCYGVERYYNNGYERFGRTKNILFKDLEKLINPNFTYLERKAHIENKSNNKIDELKKEIESIDKKISKVQKATLKELFETLDEIIVVDEYKTKDLLIFLVRNGYITEHYDYYISYFHKGGITKDDREFLLAIQNHKILNFDFPLERMEEILEKLEEKDFENKYILNNSLTSYLLLNIEKNSNFKKIYFRQLSNGSLTSKKFIFQYLDYATIDEQEKFIKQLDWKDLWLYIYETYSTSRQNRYFKLLFNSLKIEELITLNRNESLYNYLQKQTRLPLYTQLENDKCKELISALKLKFKNIQNPSDNTALFDYIYENRNYELSELMIRIMLTEKGNIDIDTLEKSHFTTINNSEAEELKEYINTNINEYVENIFLLIESNREESEETVIELLNNENINLENRVKIIQKEEIKISNITDVINKELWIELLKDNKVVANWDNILYYYQETKKVSIEMIDYLNMEENYIELSKYQIDNEEIFDKDTILSNFNKKLILCNEVNNEAYQYLIKSIWFLKYKELDIKGLDSQKIDFMIQETKFDLTQNNIDNLKENFSPKHIILIENFKEEFLERLEEFEIDKYDLILLIESSKFEIEEKFAFIKKTDLSDITDKILVKEAISEFHIDNSRYVEDIELFESLFYHENKYDLELLILQITSFDDCASCKKYLNKFDSKLNELLKISAKSLYIENNQLNRQLLEELKEKDCISSFSEKTSILGKNEFKVNRKRG